MPKIDEATVPTKSKSPKKNKKPIPKDREVVHPEIVVSVCHGETALTVEKAKELLGWEEVGDDDTSTTDFQTTDYSAPHKKIRLKNDLRNRPINDSWIKTLVQEHLNRRWRLTNEAIGVGRCGEVTDGQHRLISLVLADQARQANPHWEENWPGPVTMDIIVTFGMDESDDAINVINTGRPRSLSDVLYRSDHFMDYAPKDRKLAARICDYAIRMLWHRTGIEADAFAPRRTHAESLAFLASHKTLPKKIVRHLMEEDRSGGISAVLSPGYASAMAYLMAVSKSDPVQYRIKAKEGVRSEKYLDSSLLDKAQEFWLLVGQKDSVEMKPVRDKLAAYARRKDETGEPIPVTLAEKMAVVTLAWIAFADGRNPTTEDLKIKYVNSPDGGAAEIKNAPTLGGIDLGEEPEEDDEDGEDEDEDNPAENLKQELDSTREERVKKLIEQRKQAKLDKKAEMAAAKSPADNGKPLTVAEEVRAQFADIAKDHVGKILLLKSRTSGDLSTIDDDARKVSKALDSPATGDQKGFTRFTIKKADVKKSLGQLLEDGHQVVIAEEVVSGPKAEKTTKVTDYTGE